MYLHAHILPSHSPCQVWTLQREQGIMETAEPQVWSHCGSDVAQLRMSNQYGNHYMYIYNLWHHTQEKRWYFELIQHDHFVPSSNHNSQISVERCWSSSTQTWITAQRHDRWQSALDQWDCTAQKGIHNTTCLCKEGS